MGFGSSKIPDTVPGQVLKFIGIKPLDNAYSKFEEFAKEVDHIRTEVDLRFTDLIKSLGASKLWEIYNELKEILKMYFLVLAINLKGETRRIKYNKLDIPYIKVNKKRFSYLVRGLISDFEAYTRTLNKCKTDMESALNKLNIEMISLTDDQDIYMENSKAEDDEPNFSSGRIRGSSGTNKIQKIKEKVDQIYEKVVTHLKDANYEAVDMIKAIEIVDENNKIILKACDDIETYKRLEAEFIKIMEEAYKESEAPQRKDKMIQQIAQAVHEKIFAPSEIVAYFWPYPDS